MLPDGARATARSHRSVTLGAERHYSWGDAPARGPREGTIVTEAVKRTLPWRILTALFVACLLEVGGWVFAPDRPGGPTVAGTAGAR